MNFTRRETLTVGVGAFVGIAIRSSESSAYDPREVLPPSSYEDAPHSGRSNDSPSGTLQIRVFSEDVRFRFEKPSGVRSKEAQPWFSQERMITTASDMLTCGPAGVALAGTGAAEGWGEILGVYLAAKCLPELMGDALAPNDANAGLHSATSLLTPWGMGVATMTALTLSDKMVFPAASFANAIYNLQDFGKGLFSTSNPDTFSLIPGLDVFSKMETAVAEILSGLEDIKDHDAQNISIENQVHGDSTQRTQGGSFGDHQNPSEGGPAARKTDDPRETRPPGNGGGEVVV